MRRSINAILCFLGASAFVYITPVFYNVLFQDSQHGVYSIDSNRCMCGYRAYCYIRGNMLVDWTIGHNYYMELYELQSTGPDTFKLIGWRYDDVGTLQVHQSHLLLFSRSQNRTYRIPRVWSPWRIWFEKWRYRNEPISEKTYEDLRLKIKAFESTSSASPNPDGVTP